MDPATLSTIFLFCDSDRNILKKRGKFIYVWTCTASKNKCTTATFWKSSTYQKKVFCDVEVCLLIVLNNL